MPATELMQALSTPLSFLIISCGPELDRDSQNCARQLPILQVPLLSVLLPSRVIAPCISFHACLFPSSTSLTLRKSGASCWPCTGRGTTADEDARSWSRGAGEGASSCLCPFCPSPSSFGEHRGKQPLWLASRQMAVLKLRALITTIIFSRNILQAAWLRAVQAPARGWAHRAEQEAAGKSWGEGSGCSSKTLGHHHWFRLHPQRI